MGRFDIPGEDPAELAIRKMAEASRRLRDQSGELADVLERVDEALSETRLLLRQTLGHHADTTVDRAELRLKIGGLIADVRMWRENLAGDDARC